MRKVISVLTATFLMALFFVCPCEVNAGEILYDGRYGDGFGQILRKDEKLSAYPIRGVEKHITGELNECGVTAVEVYDFQAEALLGNSRVEFFWYPQYAVSMVLAVADDAPFPVTDWQDLMNYPLSVGIPTDPVARELAVMALSYGLSGQLKRSYGIAALSQLEKAGRLRLDSTYGETYFNQTRHWDKADVYIVTDQEAKRWRAEGLLVHVVVSKSGTLSFRKGLLSRERLPLVRGELDAELWQAGYSLYPEDRRLTPSEVEPFNRESSAIGQELKYRVLYPHTLKSVVNYPSCLPYMIFLFLTILWGSAMTRRVKGKAAERIIKAMVGVSVLWLLVRTVGLILPNDLETVSRYLWYSYYLFIGLLMPLILFLALYGDEETGKAHVARWSIGVAVFDIALALLVMTNDLHHLVFNFPQGLAGAADIHTYEPGYYFLVAVYFLELLAVMVILGRRVVVRHIGNAMFPLPFLVLLLYLAYVSAYAMRMDIAKSTEFTLVTISAFLLWMETLLDSHMIRANTGYQDFFTYSHLSMEIRDGEGQVVFQSAGVPSAKPEDVETRVMPIRGGDVVWRRDVRDLREKERALTLVTTALSRAYDLQKKEEDIRRAYARLSTERKTFRELEDIVRSKGQQILYHADFLQTAKPGHAADESVFRLNVLASYVKKRCVMFLRGEEDHQLDSRELRLSIEELFRYLAPSGLYCLLDFEITGSMPTEAALSLYDFLEELTEDAVIAGELHLVTRVEQKGKGYFLSVLLDSHPWVPDFLKERKADPRFQKDGIHMQLRDLGYAVRVEISADGRKRAG